MALEHATIASSLEQLGAADSEPKQLAGYAARWNTEYLSLFGPSMIAPGAFRLDGDAPQRVKFLWAHDESSPPIGKITRLEEDEIGLRFVADVAPTQVARDIAALVAMGAVGEASVGFLPVRKRQSGQLRVVEEAELVEISLVNWGAIPQTRVIALSEQLARRAALLARVGRIIGGMYDGRS